MPSCLRFLASGSARVVPYLRKHTLTNMTPPDTQLDHLDVTNQCVVFCDLRIWAPPDAPAWQVLKGSQDDVGRALAATLDAAAVDRIDDFGGVSKTFLCAGESYRSDPPRIVGTAAVFSFTPKNRLRAEGLAMAQVAKAAGYTLLILTLQKHDKFGKVWVLCGMLRHSGHEDLVFYEDTNTVVDELKNSAEGCRVQVVHVQAPGYENDVATRADRVVTQTQYQHEVLEGLR